MMQVFKHLIQLGNFLKALEGQNILTNVQNCMHIYLNDSIDRVYREVIGWLCMLIEVMEDPRGIYR